MAYFFVLLLCFMCMANDRICLDTVEKLMWSTKQNRRKKNQKQEEKKTQTQKNKQTNKHWRLLLVEWDTRHFISIHPVPFSHPFQFSLLIPFFIPIKLDWLHFFFPYFSLSSIFFPRLFYTFWHTFYTYRISLPCLCNGFILCNCAIPTEKRFRMILIQTNANNHPKNYVCTANNTGSFFSSYLQLLSYSL